MNLFKFIYDQNNAFYSKEFLYYVLWKFICSRSSFTVENLLNPLPFLSISSNSHPMYFTYLFDLILSSSARSSPSFINNISIFITQKVKHINSETYDYIIFDKKFYTTLINIHSFVPYVYSSIIKRSTIDASSSRSTQTPFKNPQKPKPKQTTSK